VKKGPIQANSEKTVSLNGLSAGMYFLLVENDKKELLRAKFLLK
jgi:hypothetical protein